MASIYWREDRRRWIIQYIDANGARRTRVAPAGSKKRNVQALAVKLEGDELDIRSGRVDRYARYRETAVGEALEDYLAHLEAAGRSREHTEKVRRNAEAVIGAANWTILEDLDAVGLTRFLRDQARREPPVAPATRNHYRWAVFGWAKWLVESRRLATNPFEAVARARVTEQAGRRALSPEELAALMAAARTRQEAQYKAPHRMEKALREGEDRAILYLVAATTGLRKGELKRLTWADIDLENRSIRVRASSAKARKEQVVQLPHATAEAMKAWKRTKPGETGGNPFWIPKDLHRHFEADCKAATPKIPKVTADGRVDFHCLRVTYVTGLARAGVHPAIAQRLARHSTMEMTLRHYTDIRVADDAAAANAAWGSFAPKSDCAMTAPTARKRGKVRGNEGKGSRARTSRKRKPGG